MMEYRQKFFLCICSLFSLLVFSGHSAAGENLTVAVAANFAPAMEEISRRFTHKTGIPVQVTVSSSGRLYAQIRNGAPFDLFFSADSKRPDMLFREGHCAEPVEYVRGRVVLWSRHPRFCEESQDWRAMVSRPGLKKIGMANPELAPYGAVGKEALVENKLWRTVQKHLVFGANVGQSFQYAAIGVADASFIALSLANTPIGAQGCKLPVPDAKPVSQAACIVRTAKNKDGGQQFLDFLGSEEIQSILLQFGYMEPEA